MCLLVNLGHTECEIWCKKNVECVSKKLIFMFHKYVSEYDYFKAKTEARGDFPFLMGNA